jgi:osmotically-inducible protein OsmY
MPKKIMLAVLLAPVWLSACAPLVVGGAVVTAVTVAHDRRSAGRVVDDKIIQAKAQKAIYSALKDSKHVKVDVYNGVVLLTGEVLSAEDKRRAEDAAASIAGVRKVVNELRIGYPTRVKQRLKDASITSRVKTALLKIDLPDFDPTRVKVTTVDGTVYLMGLVTRKEAAAVTERVRRMKGVKKVVTVFEYLD